MKSLLLKIFIVCSLCGLSQVQSTKDVSQVLGNMKEQESSWNQGDIRGFMRHYWQSDSLKFIGSKGVTYGWQRTLDNYLKGYSSKEAMGVLKFSIIEASQLSPASIYVIGKWELEKEKPAGGHFTLLWKKIKGAWVIVADHTS